MVLRYRDRTRMNHWFVAILFFCAGLTGLAIFHPFFYPLVNLFGGGVWTRILHPFFGVVMALGFFGLFLAMWRENVMDSGDRAWLEAQWQVGRTLARTSDQAAAVLVLCDGLVWSELGAALPGSGGTYHFLREIFGRYRWGRIMPRCATKLCNQGFSAHDPRKWPASHRHWRPGWLRGHRQTGSSRPPRPDRPAPTSRCQWRT